jgi:DNA-directed RNA polymerase subunit RPC12/RpoP
MAWDPDQDALVCAHCSQRIPVPRAEGTIVEHALEDAGSAARGLGLETRAVRCKNCGAAVTFDAATTAQECVFCGSPQVLGQTANRNSLRPESVIPLDVGRATVEREFRAWLKRLWFRPSALRVTRHLHAVGVYLPYWTFDCAVHSDWSANAGYYYWVTEPYMTMVNGRPTMRTRQVRKVRWVPAWGQRDDAYDDVLIAASRGVSEKLLEGLGKFDMAALVPYRPEYLAGWRAEEYAIDLDAGWKHAQAHVEQVQAQRCAGDVPGDTHQGLRVANRIAGVHWKHVLLPVWVLTYAFSGKNYTVLIHGQTGRVIGNAPYSWVKIAALVIGVLAASLLVLGVIAVAGS